MPTKQVMTADIIREARARGIDENIALRVARGEALDGPWQSQIFNKGRQENSFSPWQLNIDSPQAVGSAFMKATGLDPRDEKNWPAMNKYALDHAKKYGWKDWMGAKANGVTGFMGINSSPVPPGSLDNRLLAPQLDTKNMVPPGTPMQMAMNGGIPSMTEQFQMAKPTPMQSAMEPVDIDQNARGMGAIGAQQETPGWFERNYGKSSNFDLSDRLLGAGAALQSINGDGKTLAAMLEMRRGSKNRYSTQQLWDGTVIRVDRDSGDTSIVRSGDSAYADKKRGIPDADTAAAILQGSNLKINDMIGKIDKIANDPELEWIAGGKGQLPTGFGEWSLSGGKAAELKGLYDSVMSQGTLDEVQRLKESSSTLGQISNYEDMLFQKAFAPINPGMKAEDMKRVLLEKAAVLRELQQIRNDKYKNLYGREPGEVEGAPMTSPPAAPGAAAPGAGGTVEEWIRGPNGLQRK
jgi:hypothetical protein